MIAKGSENSTHVWPRALAGVDEFDPEDVGRGGTGFDITTNNQSANLLDGTWDMESFPGSWIYRALTSTSESTGSESALP